MFGQFVPIDLSGIEGVEITPMKRESEPAADTAATREPDTSELSRLRAENDRLRAALAVSKDPCVYCQLPAAEMAKCKSGFPGCDRADDMTGCPEFGSSYELSMIKPQYAALSQEVEQLRRQADTASRAAGFTVPVPMYLTCPKCGARHVDAGEFATKPHHTHSCQECGLTWRPAVVPTVGVQFLPGFKDERKLPSADARVSLPPETTSQPTGRDS